MSDYTDAYLTMIEAWMTGYVCKLEDERLVKRVTRPDGQIGFVTTLTKDDIAELLRLNALDEGDDDGDQPGMCVNGFSCQ